MANAKQIVEAVQAELDRQNAVYAAFAAWREDGYPENETGTEFHERMAAAGIAPYAEEK